MIARLNFPIPMEDGWQMFNDVFTTFGVYKELDTDSTISAVEEITLNESKALDAPDFELSSKR